MNDSLIDSLIVDLLIDCLFVDCLWEQTRHRITLLTAGLDSLTLLLGQIVYSVRCTPFRKVTSSPENTVSSSTPSCTRFRHPTMQFRTTHRASSTVPSRIVAFSTTQPSPSFTSFPSTTFGPTLQFSPTSAVACYDFHRFHCSPYLQHVPLRPVRLHELALVHGLRRLALQASDMRQIEPGALQIVARLTDVHPEPAQNHPVELLVRSHLREDLALDRRRLILRVRNRETGKPGCGGSSRR